MKKRIVAVVLFAVAFICMPQMAKAETYDNLTYQMNQDNAACTITGVADNTESVVIPEFINNIRVSNIAPEALRNDKALKNLIVYGNPIVDVNQEYFAEGVTVSLYASNTSYMAGYVSSKQKGTIFPTNLQVKGKAAVNKKTLKTVSLSWDSSLCVGVSGYMVRSVDPKTNVSQDICPVVTNSVPLNITPGKTVYYTVTPYYYLGDGKPIAYCLSSTATKAVARPDKVKKFKATAHHMYITLHWAKASNITGYQVQCKANLKIKIKGWAPKFNTIKNIKKTKYTSLKNTHLVKGMRYSYRIRAYKQVGKKKIYSDYVYVNKKKCK
jgi:hypothetical protein